MVLWIILWKNMVSLIKKLDSFFSIKGLARPPLKLMLIDVLHEDHFFSASHLRRTGVSKFWEKPVFFQM